MKVSVLGRAHFEELRSATVEPVSSNVYEVTVHTDKLPKRVKRGSKLEDWDGAVFLLDELETEPAVAVRQTASTVVVTVFVLS